VQAVLAARIDRLAAREKTVLQAAAVIGKEFSQQILERVVELGAQEIEEVLRDLVAGEFVYEQEPYPEPIYAFKHPLTQEVAYGSQLTERRARVHAAVARATVEHYPERLDERAALVARHWEAAGERLEAAGWYARAATWSGHNDPTETLRHWHKVRELTDALPDSTETVELGLAARINVLNYGYRLGISPEEAEAAFTEAQRMAVEAGDIHSRVFLLGAYSFVRGFVHGELREQVELARRAFALAEESGDPALYVAIASLAVPFLMIGEHSEGLAMLDRALELAGGDPSMGADTVIACPYAYCHTLKGGFLMMLGELAEARRLIERGREIAKERGDIENVGWSHQWSANLAYFAGEPEAMLAHAQREVEIAERIGDAFLRSFAWFVLGTAEWARGEWRRAIEAIERSREISGEYHRRTSVEQEAWRLALLGESYLGIGEAKRARALAAEGVELARAQESTLYEATASLSLARVLLGTDGPAARDGIEALLARALELTRERGTKAYEPHVHVELAELARQLGDEKGRERELREAHSLFTEIGATGHAERLAGELATVA
jgi:tetratricopeptide (TPR) repeat protein